LGCRSGCRSKASQPRGLVSIDRDLYTIVAVDLRIDGPATVYAVDGFHRGSDHTATLRS